MTNNVTCVETRLHLVHGGAGAQVPLPDLAMPALGCGEWAAEMAELFAMGLMGSAPLDSLTDPHCAVPLTPTQDVSLHEILCELRNVPWLESPGVETPTPWSTPQSARTSGAADLRRDTRWNVDGQLTLGSLFRAGAAMSAEGAGPSALLIQDATASGSRGFATLNDMAAHVFSMPAGRPFRSAATAALARNTAPDPGLPMSEVSGGWVMDLLATAEQRATALGFARMGRPDRLMRPVVMAARMSLYLSNEIAQQTPGPMQAAADILAETAPGLLHWTGLVNLQRKTARACAARLFLPLEGAGAPDMHPSDVATHMVVAGAMATILKAVFDTQRRTSLHMVGRRGPDVPLAEQLDRLTANIAVARLVSGSHYTAENHQDLRLGQMIGLHVLRDSLIAENRSATMGFQDFDGHRVQLRAHPRPFGRADVALWQDGEPATWPQDKEHRTAHLTAV